MKKSISITLEGQVFHVEEDAFEYLKKYLDSIQNYFSLQEDGHEIIKDIESSIAEHFSAALSPAKKIITKNDIEKLTASMGKIEDFQVFDEKKNIPKNREKNIRRRLYRDTKSKVLGGVASGIANYFGIDPVIVRLIFIVPLLLSIIFANVNQLGSFLASVVFASITAYILLWFIVPKAKTVAEKMEMQGKELTLSTLAEQAQQEEKQNTTPKNFFSLFFNFLGEVIAGFSQLLKKILLVIARIGGLFILAISIILTIAWSFQFFFGFFVGIFKVPITLPIFELIRTSSFYIIMICLYIGILVPLLLAMVLGRTLWKLKNAFRIGFTSVTLTLWIIAITLGGAVALQEMPRFEEKWQTYNEAKTFFDLKDFSEIEFQTPFNAFITQGDHFEVAVKRLGETGVKAKVEGKRLILFKESYNQVCVYYCDDFISTVFITIPKLEYIANFSSFDSNSSSIKIENLSTEELEIINNGEGSSTISIQGNIQNLKAELGGMAQLWANGKIKNLEAALTDTAHLRANVIENISSGKTALKENEFKIERVNLTASGSTDSSINAQNLTITAKDFSSVEYYGNPVLNVTTEGNAKVIPASQSIQ